MSVLQERRYKEVTPEETVAKVKKILDEIGIEVEEKWTDKSSVDTYSLRICIKGSDVGQNGKGMTREFAMASGYAEFLERLQNGLFRFRMEKPTEELPFINVPDEKYFSIDEYIGKDNSYLQNILKQNSKENKTDKEKKEYLKEVLNGEYMDQNNKKYTYRIKCYTRTVDIITFYNKSFFEKNCIIDYEKYKWHPNLFLEIKAIDGNDSALARYDASQNRIVKLNYENYFPYSQVPKNVGQKMTIEALLEKSDKAPLVIIKGCAGTGKTFQTLAVALEKTLEQHSEYNQILITSPTETVGQENLGFLPGDIEEKYNPHLGGIRDNLRILLSSKKDSSGKEKNSSKTAENKVNALFSKGIIQIQPIGFLRGRTIVDTIFIIDETQNIDPHDIKSIVSRAGKGSKFVFLGDPSQIDNPHLNENYNGLVYISEKMKGNDLAWQVTLTESESVRSDLAKLATIIL